jgi:hypothetical protein
MEVGKVSIIRQMRCVDGRNNDSMSYVAVAVGDDFRYDSTREQVDFVMWS